VLLKKHCSCEPHHSERGGPNIITLTNARGANLDTDVVLVNISTTVHNDVIPPNFLDGICGTNLNLLHMGTVPLMLATLSWQHVVFHMEEKDTTNVTNVLQLVPGVGFDVTVMVTPFPSGKSLQ
jgi:hypothetical protein